MIEKNSLDLAIDWGKITWPGYEMSLRHIKGACQFGISGLYLKLFLISSKTAFKLSKTTLFRPNHPQLAQAALSLMEAPVDKLRGVGDGQPPRARGGLGSGWAAPAQVAGQ